MLSDIKTIYDAVEKLHTIQHHSILLYSFIDKEKDMVKKSYTIFTMPDRHSLTECKGNWDNSIVMAISVKEI